MHKAVNTKSLSPGSGLDKYKALFIFEASNLQLDIPTNAKGLFYSSNKLCRTFNGLCFEISASPISSKRKTTIILSPASVFRYLFPFSYACLIPSEVQESDP